MEIRSAEFIKGVVGSEGLPTDGKPQIAFVGRSNVGKSSLINSLTGRKGLAISSSKPGRTMQLNYFLINDELYFVDLPGYGYAKTSLKHAEKMRRMIMWYLESPEARPQKVVLIIDAKVGPTKFDLEMFDLLAEQGYEVILVANKADKVKSSEQVKNRRMIAEKIDCKDILYYSTETKKGKEELLARIVK